MEPICQLVKLKKYFPESSGIFQKNKRWVKAVEQISLDIKKGEVLGIVGESGCGKSTLGRTLIKIYEPTQGKIIFDGKDITHIKGRDLKSFRKSVQMIFQDPYSSLNPRKTIKSILMQPLLIHEKNSSLEEKKDRIVETLQLVGLNSSVLKKYPHQFSGGQRQRIAIARSIIVRPRLLIADEPVSALDVSVQSEILNLLKTLQKKLSLTIVFIAHDLSVVNYMSDRIAVMYLGKLVELAETEKLYSKPLHPYTQFLLVSNPVIGGNKNKKRMLLKGELPSPMNPPSGCHFHLRCPFVENKCIENITELKNINGSLENYKVACHKVISNERFPDISNIKKGS